MDLSDPTEITRIVTEVGKRRGRIDVLHFNPSIFREADPLKLTIAELIEDFTKSWHQAASLGVQKAAVRTRADAM